jgi:hypothetical protein
MAGGQDGEDPVQSRAGQGRAGQGRAGQEWRGSTAQSTHGE